jgi:hypothetical protein
MQVQVLRAWPKRYEAIDVQVADDAVAQAALDAAGWQLDATFVALAVFGQAATAQTRLHAGDRIELLRSLQLDPKQARRLRALRSKAG